MQLSKLEIKGFKSFGEKVIINFDAGITGIVGPNGCGKSNVIDAIRWVLGEQSTKALRSEKMENVIFNGTKNRKALQLAEVSLTFNNTKNLLPTEYSQVTITRRYYRTGDSEYLLNNVVCRLKDITNLFLDTGIGSDSYAIIELKMVDDILNDKDHSRRHLFEEAAGISKFKLRKKETLKKLTDTDADLERVEDLLFEITKNMKSLEKQAKQTENYFKLKEEYKKYSVALATKTVLRQREVVENLVKQVEKETDRKQALQTQILEKEAIAEKEKTDLITKEKTLASRQKALNDHVTEIRQYENEKNVKNERLRFLNDKIKNLTAQITEDKKTAEILDSDLQRLQTDLAGIENTFAEVEKNSQTLQADYETQRQTVQVLQKDLNLANQQYRQKQDELFQLRKEIDVKQTQLETLRQELERNSQNESSQQADIDEFNEVLYELKEKLKLAEKEVADKQKVVTETKSLLENLDTEIDTIRHDIAHLNRNLDARQNEYNLTKSLVENLEGFPDAIKFLKQQVREMKNMPLLSDILTCPDEYRVSIENFLEPFMNFFVVETQAQAIQAVNLLSDSAKGKANFFVLDNFEKYKSDSLISKSSSENLLSAFSVVEFDKKYEKLVEYLLDEVYLVKTEEALTGNGNKTYLSENGKIIKRPFSISGGSVGLFEGKRIGRAKNLEKLSEEIKSHSGELQQLTQQLTEKQAVKSKNLVLLQEAEKGQRESQASLQKIQQEYFSVKTRQEQLRELVSVQSLRKDEMQSKINDLQAFVEDLRPEAEEKSVEVKELEVKINRLNQDLQLQNEILNQKSSEFNEKNTLFFQQKSRLDALKQEISFKSQNAGTVAGRLKRNTEDAGLAENDLKNLLESNEVQEDELVERYKEKEEITKAVNEAERIYYQSRGEIDKLEKEARELQRQRENADSLIQQLQNQRNEAQLQLTAVRERLSVEFEVDLDKLQPTEGEEDIKINKLPEEELRLKVQGIKQSLDRIGPINPLALEAYQEIKERYDFITNQKKDLTDAKNSLLATITEIDTVARETFMTAFTNIRENFIMVFRSLFSEEDSCDLKLADMENPLDSAIDIIAKPRGKRPLTINQLSGGEKTLTAISLLFAIYLLKPAPFCIFDEVDAPLDDANIDKFNNIIKKFAGESQFIIVTHNKRTMASVDIIYGVSMMAQDYGVSRVVPVDLRELV
jgi:chromosome segregation protein